MVQKASTRLKFKDVWTFPYEVEKRIAEFVTKHPGVWLHAPVGISKIGLGSFDKTVKMITLDKDAELKPDIVCDIFKMNEEPTIKKFVEAGGFDGVISDPLWYRTLKCSKCGNIMENPIGLAYPDRRYLSFQVRDVLKPGGWWLFNGLWNPKVKGFSIKKIETPIQAFSSFRNVSLLVYCQRVNEKLV